MGGGAKLPQRELRVRGVYRFTHRLGFNINLWEKKKVLNQLLERQFIVSGNVLVGSGVDKGANKLRIFSLLSIT